MATPTTEDLVYAIMLIQLEIVPADDVRDLLHEANRSQGKRLREVLLENRCVTPHQDDFMAAMVAAHLSFHGGDAHRSLEALERSAASQIVLPASDEDDGATVTFDSDGADHSTRPDEDIQLSRPAAVSGRFRRIRPHAAGGLGEVILARDDDLNRDVALKQLQQGQSADEAKRRRFMLEGRVTGALEHPGIVPVYAIGVEASGEPFYVMRFIKGESLRRLVKRFHDEHPESQRFQRSCLDFRRVLGRIVDVCQALEYAHRRGVVHRDIKPANIMLGKHGETYVVDWGLAHVATGPTEEPSIDEEYLERSRGDLDAATQQGSIVGTPGYMSPEQAGGMGGIVGPWSDVYALGAMLYFVLTGRAPLEIDGGDIGGFLSKLQEGQLVSPRSFCSKVPRELEAVCLRALQLQPEERYQSAADFAQELERWLGDEPVEAATQPLIDKLSRWGRRHRKAVAVGALVLTTLAVGAWLAAYVINGLRVRAEDLARDNRELAIAEATARSEAERRYLNARENIDRWLVGFTDALGYYPGTQEIRRRLLEEAAAEYASFAAEKVQDSTLRYERGLTLMRLGTVHRTLGDALAAIEALDAAVEEFSQLSAESFVGSNVNAARARGMKAMAIADTGDLAAAISELQTVSEALTELVAKGDDTTEARTALATIGVNLGLVETRAGNLIAASDAFSRAIEELKQLIATAPNDAKRRANLATAQIGYGQVLLQEGQTSAAEESFDTAADTFSALNRLNPDDPAYLESLAATRLNQAATSRRLGDVEGEAAAYRFAIEAYDDLANLRPDLPVYREGLGMAKTDLGQALLSSNHVEQALAPLKEAVNLLGGLASKYPTNPSRREAYAVALDNLAVAYLKRADAAEGLEASQAAGAALKPLVEAWPSISQYEQRYAVALAHQAHAYELAANTDAAIKAFRIALETAENAAGKPDSPASTKQSAAIIASRLADTLWFNGQKDEAKEVYTRAMEHWDSLLGTAEDPEFLDEAAWFLTTCPHATVADRRRALALADRATQAAEKNEGYRSTRRLAEAAVHAAESGTGTRLVSRPNSQSDWFAEAFRLLNAGDASKARDTLATAERLRLSSMPGDWRLAALSAMLHERTDGEGGVLSLFPGPLEANAASEQPAVSVD